MQGSVLRRVSRHLSAPYGSLSRPMSSAGNLLAALDNSTPARHIPDTSCHIVSHCKVPEGKGEEFFSLARELIPNCRTEPHQVYQHILRARPEFGRDPETEFVWLEEWTQDSGFTYHCSGTPYNTHFHNIVDEYVDERCTVYRGPEGLIMLPLQEHMRGYTEGTKMMVEAPSRKDHVFVVSHVHVHAHKRAEFLVKAATLLPHCRAEKVGC